MLFRSDLTMLENRLPVVRWPRGDGDAALWDYVDEARRNGRIKLRACYCSMFDECWVAKSDDIRPAPVEHCPG